MKACEDCNVEYLPTGNYQKTCPACRTVRNQARARAYRQANPHKQREKAARYRLKNIEGVRSPARRSREKNLEARRAGVLAWKVNNPDKYWASVKASKHKRKAPGHITSSDVRQIMAHPCAYCGGPASELEHCTPISRGGWHQADNLVAACRQCNRSKGARTVLEFLGMWPAVAGWG